MNNVHTGGPAGRQTPGGSPATSAAAAMAPGQTLPLEGPRSRPLTGDENQPLKPKSRRPGAQVALTVSSTGQLLQQKQPHLWRPPPQHRRQRPPAHQHHTSERAAAPKRTGRSSLPFLPRERERDRPRTRVPPSRRTTCCAADSAGRTWTWPARTRHNRRLGWRTDSCTLSKQLQFAFLRMAGGRLLRTAGGCPSPPNTGRTGSLAHAEAGPDSPRPPP